MNQWILLIIGIVYLMIGLFIATLLIDNVRCGTHTFIVLVWPILIFLVVIIGPLLFAAWTADKLKELYNKRKIRKGENKNV